VCVSVFVIPTSALSAARSRSPTPAFEFDSTYLRHVALTFFPPRPTVQPAEQVSIATLPTQGGDVANGTNNRKTLSVSLSYVMRNTSDLIFLNSSALTNILLHYMLSERYARVMIVTHSPAFLSSAFTVTAVPNTLLAKHW